MQTALVASWTDIASLVARRDDWQTLVDNALEPNPFYGPDYLTASETYLHPNRPIRCLTVTDPLDDNRLYGLFPLQRPVVQHALLGLTWSLHTTPYACLTTPLVVADRAKDVIATALAFLAGEPGPSTLFLSLTAENRPFARALQQVIQSRSTRWTRLNAHKRAGIETSLSVEEYRQTRWSKQQRKNHDRLSRKLAEAGSFEVERVTGDTPGASDLLEAFLMLEAKSWKGAEGTALSLTPTRHAFARAALLGSTGTDRLFEVLRLDGKPIAIHIDLISNGTAFSIKSTYDPEFAHLSPGRYLDGEAIALTASGGRFTRMDSCAGPNHPMERIWIEREPIAGWLIEIPGRSRSPLFGATIARIRLAARLSAWRHPKSYTTRKT